MVFWLFSLSISFAEPGDELIKLGMRGDEVLAVQKALAETGFYAGELDGVFGSATLSAVRQFQESNGLMPDGCVGKETWNYLKRSAGLDPTRYNRVIAMTATAYTAYDEGNSNTTYRGNILRKGLVAVDPTVIPLGTRLYISGYGYAIADDIGGSIKGNRIDLAFSNRDEAIQFGIRKVTVYILD